MMNIVLATASPYRIEAMRVVGIPFEAIKSDVDEYFAGRPSSPYELVKCLSRMKAEEVAKDCIDSLVIGLDSVGFFGGIILEKPRTREEAAKRLKMLSGCSHEFYTGVTAINTKTKDIYQEVVMTQVRFRELKAEEISRYLDQDASHLTRALGYDPSNHLSATFIRDIHGDLFNLSKGIPIATILSMIQSIKE